jgi:general secretion pathway protein I
MRSPRAHGFTLVEILVALAVLGVVGGALLQLFHGSLRNVALAADYSRAALLARSKLAELEARELFVAGEEQGRFDDHYHWYLRTADYAEAEDAPPPPGPLLPMAVSLAVGWQDGDMERWYTVQTLFLVRAPEAAPEGAAP